MAVGRSSISRVYPIQEQEQSAKDDKETDTLKGIITNGALNGRWDYDIDISRSSTW
jgi:hypothetical protein